MPSSDLVALQSATEWLAVCEFPRAIGFIYTTSSIGKMNEILRTRISMISPEVSEKRLWLVDLQPHLGALVTYRVHQQKPDAQNFNSKETLKKQF